MNWNMSLEKLSVSKKGDRPQVLIVPRNGPLTLNNKQTLLLF